MWKNIKQQYTKLDNEFQLLENSYSVSDTQDYIEYIRKVRNSAH